MSKKDNGNRRNGDAGKDVWTLDKKLEPVVKKEKGNGKK